MAWPGFERCVWEASPSLILQTSLRPPGLGEGFWKTPERQGKALTRLPKCQLWWPQAPQPCCLPSSWGSEKAPCPATTHVLRRSENPPTHRCCQHPASHYHHLSDMSQTPPHLLEPQSVSDGRALVSSFIIRWGQRQRTSCQSHSSTVIESTH